MARFSVEATFANGNPATVRVEKIGAAVSLAWDAALPGVILTHEQARLLADAIVSMSRPAGSGS
jgi:hypothetical protein